MFLLPVFGILFTGIWTRFTWSITDWLSTPELVLVPLFALSTLPLFLKSRNLRNWIAKPAAITIFLYLMLASPVMARGLVWGLDNRLIHWWYQSQEATPSKAEDAVVILGRGGTLTEARIQFAAQQEQVKNAPLIFASGVSEAVDMITELKRLGVPAEKLQGEECSLTTEENAIFTTALLYPQGVRRILLVTDPMHMLRSLLTFQSFGFQVTPLVSPLPWSMSSVERSFSALREYFGLLAYGLRGRFQTRPTPVSSAFVQHRLEAWHCSVRG